MNICPDISNPEVKREFDNLKLFTKNPYQLWDLNGGYELSKAPNGKNSKFYESLAFRYGDPVKALKQKAYYLTNKDSLNFPLDENGDPLYSSWYARLVNTTPETTKVISDVLPLKGNENQYSEAGLLNDKGKLKQYKSSAQANRIATKLNVAYKINTKSANDRFLVKPVPNGFRVFIKGSIEERVPETSKPVDRYNPLDNFYMGDEQLREQENKQDSIFNQMGISQIFDKSLANKIERKLKELYPEIKLMYSNSPIWEKSKNIFNQKEQLNNAVDYRLKSVDILLSDRAKQIFDKAGKAKWNIDKILQELQLPKEQKQLVIDIANELAVDGKTIYNLREQLALELASKYGYSVEVHTAKEKLQIPSDIYNFNLNSNNYSMSYYQGVEDDYTTYFKNGKEISYEEYDKAQNEYLKIFQEKVPTQHYSDLSAPGNNGNKYQNDPDWEYQELEISTPLVTPSIKGHAQFATEQGIGWARVWYNKKTGVVEIQEIQSDLFQKWRNNFEFESNKYTAKKDSNNVWRYYKNDNEINANEYTKTWESFLDTYLDNVDAFTKLLQKDNNWVTFFIKSIVQDSTKKGYEKVLFPTGNTASKIEGHQTLEEFKKYKEDRIKELSIPQFVIKPANSKSKTALDFSGAKKYNSIEEAKTALNSEDSWQWGKNPTIVNMVDLHQNEINQLKTELERIEGPEGFAALKPIYNFYENTVTNILKKTYGKDNVKVITDEYGNQWREMTINQARDLDNILLQKNEADRIIGQANIKAMNILIDAINQKQDTLPHEYAHHYIAWFRNTPIVQEAIKKWGGEEALVQSIGEQVVKQKGEAYNWWNKFVKWVLDKFNSLSKLQKEELTQILTDAFLTREDLSKIIVEPSTSYRLPTSKFEAPLKALDNKLITLLDKLNIKTISDYETLKDKLGVDALGFTELAFGTAEISVRKFRDRLTLPEEASHVFVAMLNDDYKKRLFTELKKSSYYKTILGEEYESYKEIYKNDEDALIFEAAGKLLAQVFINKELGIEQLPPTTRNLLQRIWDYLRILIGKFPIHLIEKELNILTEEIADRFLNNDITDIASIKNITPVGKNKDITKVLRITRSKIKSEKELLEKTLISSTKRLNYYKSQLDSAKASKNKEQVERLQRLVTKNEELQKNIYDSIQNKTYLDGITEYLKGLNEEHESYIKAIESISKQLNKFEMKDMGVISSRLKTMKYTIDTNRGTLKALSLNLNNLFSEEKELAKTLSKQATDLYGLFETLNDNYTDLGSIIVSEVFKTFLGDRNNQDIIDDINRNRVEKDKISILDLKQTLESTEGDINFITRWLDALADTPDDISKIIDVVVKEAKTSARLQAIDDQKDLLTGEEKITKAGLRSEFVAETHKGKITGDFVVENDWTSFRLAEKEFYKKLKEEYGVDNSNEIKDKKILEAYNKKISKFYSEYTLSTYQPIVNGEVFMSEAEKFIEQKKKELSSREFTIWEHFNVEYRANGSPIVLKNKSEQYKEIQSDPTKKAYYDAILNLKYELDMLLPPKMRHPRRLPQIKKDFIERFITFSRRRQKEDLQTLFGEFKDMFVVTEDQDDRGVKFSLTNDGENEVKFLPIYYVNKLQDPNTLSLDVTSTMSIFSAMARDFGEMNKIKDLLEIAKDVINEREIHEIDENGKPIIESIKVFGEKLTRNLKKPGEKSMIAARLQDYYDMVIYGETTKDLGKIKGTKIDTAKVIQNYLMYSSINSLSLNLFAGTANIINGVVNTHIDSQTAQYVSNSSLVYADKILARDLPQLLSGIGAVDERGRLNKKYAKSNLFFQINDTFQDHNPATKSLHAGRKNFFIRLFNSSSLFVINRGGEYWLQGRMSLALANEYRYKDGKFVWKSEFYKELSKVDYELRDKIKQLSKPTKQEIESLKKEYASKSKELKTKLDAEWGGMTNYYEAHEVIGNKIKLKKGFKDNLKDRTRFTNRTNSINKSLHGIYNDIDKSAAQQNMWFNIVNQFRKWMIPFWNRRYQKLQYNYERDAWTEGYYVSAFNFIKNLISEYKAGEVSLRKNWNTLSDLEKANFKRAMVEMSYVIGFMVLAFVLGSLDWDDKDEMWVKQMAAYQANRMITEIGAMSPTPLMMSEGFRIIQRPIPGSSHIQNIFTLITPWEWFDEIERGRFEGMNHLQRAVIKGTPVVSQVTTWNSIEEKMIFFDR